MNRPICTIELAESNQDYGYYTAWITCLGQRVECFCARTPTLALAEARAAVEDYRRGPEAITDDGL